jgi:ribokinase
MSKLINLGSLCIDQVYRVPHLTGAGETVASLSHQVFPGGKGLNQSLAAARAGAQVIHIGCIGSDGSFLVEVLDGAGVDVTGVRCIPSRQSGHAVIQVDDQGENAIVIAGGCNRLLETQDVLRATTQALQGDWLLLQNEINDLPGVLTAARKCAARVALNVAPADAASARYDLGGVDLLIVNEIEAAVLAATSPDEPQAAVEILRARYPLLTVVQTLGGQGLLYSVPGQVQRSMAALPARTVDETAAGDAFIGYLLAGLLAGVPLADALLQGSAAGALAVTRAGAANSIPDSAEVKQLLAETQGQ